MPERLAVLLILDTATDFPLFATSDDLTRPWLPADGDVAEKIAVALERLAEDPARKSVAGIVVGCGPGSYTGLRVALSVAEVWGYAERLPICPVSSLASLAPTAELEGELLARGIFRPALVFDARGGGVYASLGRPLSSDGLSYEWGRPSRISVASFRERFAACDAILSCDAKRLAARSEELKWRGELIETSPRAHGLARAANGSRWLHWETLYSGLEVDYLRGPVGTA